MIGDRVSDRNNNTSYTEKYQKHKHIPCSFAYKVVCIDYKFSKPFSLYRRKTESINLLKQFLQSMITSKVR